MSRRYPLFAVGLALAAALPAVARDLTPKYNDPVENYTEVDVDGWTLLVNKRLDKHPEQRREALDAVRWQLWMIERICPPKAVQVMKGTKIWLEYKCVASAQYHPGRDWLVKNNYNPAKAKCVDVGDVTRYSRPIPGRAAMVLLHEMIHAWHDKALGFDDERIIKAYQRSRDSGVYDSVIRDRHVKVKHYALTNPREWFAEISETYLWVNDYYPFNRAELKIADPQTYDLMEEIWGMRTPTEEELRKQEQANQGETDKPAKSAK